MRVLVCDDHALMVRILAEHLQDAGHDVATAESPEQALEQQRVAPADVCVLDLRFGNSPLDGAHAVERLLSLSPSLRVLLLSSHPDSALARRAVAAGAHALLDKSRPLAAVTEAVRRIGGGEAYVPSQPSAAPAPLPEELSAREREVLTLLVRGCSTTQISDLLGISAHTVRRHVQRLLHELGVGTRLEAVAVAVHHGLVPTHAPHGSVDDGRLAGAR